MKKLTLNYVCFALSALCLLLMSCKGDDDFVDKEDLVDTELVNYKVTLFRILDSNKPNPLPDNCILFYDKSNLSGSYVDGDFFYKGDRYHIYGLPISEMRSWTQNKSSVKVLLSGIFVEDSKEIPHSNTKSSSGDTDIVFCIRSIILK